MKTWHLLPLVIFIGVAGYQFGYYRAKLADSPTAQAPLDALTDNTMDALDEALPPVPVVASASAARPADHAPVAPATHAAPLPREGTIDIVRRIVKDNPDAGEIAVPLNAEGTEWQGAGEAELTTRGQLAELFAAHTLSRQVDFYAMHCEPDRCLLIGEASGQADQWLSLLESLQVQPAWPFQTGQTYTTQHNLHTDFLTELRR